MVDETKDEIESGLGENLSAVGQMIIGEIEAVGGILTGDPLTRAEGEFNVEVGSLHQESNKILTAIDRQQETTQNTAEQNASQD